MKKLLIRQFLMSVLVMIVFLSIHLTAKFLVPSFFVNLIFFLPFVITGIIVCLAMIKNELVLSALGSLNGMALAIFVYYVFEDMYSKKPLICGFLVIVFFIGLAKEAVNYACKNQIDHKHLFWAIIGQLVFLAFNLNLILKFVT